MEASQLKVPADLILLPLSLSLSLSQMITSVAVNISLV